MSATWSEIATLVIVSLPIFIMLLWIKYGRKYAPDENPSDTGES